MIVITGGAGFIGSAFAWKCNQEGREDLLIVDELGESESWQNLVSLSYQDYFHKDDFLDALMEGAFDELGIEAIIHMGACSATTETDGDYLMENNYRYTQYLAEWAHTHGARFIYASSAATYGNGEMGFTDDLSLAPSLRPTNRYGYSKQLFDLYAIRTGLIDRSVGLKFFNVFGPNEYHKEDMKSVICKAHGQILETGNLKLFKSYKADYADGDQKRDFVYVKDCVDVMWWLLENPEVNGLFNLGTGQARSWNDLAKAVFSALDKPVSIDYIEMPEHIRGHYQYFTEADMNNLKAAGCPITCRPLEEAVSDYVTNYLNPKKHLSV